VQAHALHRVNINHTALASLAGQIVAANVPNFAAGAGFLFRKGQVLAPDDVTKLPDLLNAAPASYSLHLLQLETGDVRENEAGQRLAAMVAGPGLVLHGPIESRMNMLARWRGLLKIDVARLDRLNEVPGVAVFTLFNDQAVEAGQEVAGAKVTPLVVAEKYLHEAHNLSQNGPVIEVKPFLPRKVGVVVRESLPPKARARFEAAVAYKISWFGGKLLGIETSLSDVTDLVSKLATLQRQGAELILHVGGHSTDPLDPIHEALAILDVRLEKNGAPAHPGTLFWLGYFPHDTTALFGLASCGMFSKTTLGDLFLAKFFAGEQLSYKDVAKMGHGGLLGREMAFRFPPYNLKDSE